MALYNFIVTGLDPVLAIQSQAGSDADAYQEALRFAGELMRESSLAERGSFDLTVRVTAGDDREVCWVGASSRAPIPS